MPCCHWSSRGSKNQPQRHYGIISLIILAPPKDIDCIHTQKLVEAIKPSGALKDGQELSHSLVVLGNLNPLVNEWISELSEKSSPSAAASVGGKIVPLGSYWLRAHTKGGGRDVVSVAPRHIERSDSFQSFFEILKHQEEIKNLRATDAALELPVCRCFPLKIDLMFARPSVQTVSDNLDLGDDWHLRSLDMRCILSLNGNRAFESSRKALLKMVGDSLQTTTKLLRAPVT
uniref:Poly(A) polymerase nucleotidyltransferase domain-containing protein n=1 Tax=Athene cunicularia TaxID=194338 RepID=A0A663MTW3_ATHCN